MFSIETACNVILKLFRENFHVTVNCILHGGSGGLDTCMGVWEFVTGIALKTNYITCSLDTCNIVCIHCASTYM